MHGEIKADLATMPLENMAFLLGGVAILLIITGVVIVNVVRKLGIKSFGPFKLEHNNSSSLYDMNEKIKDFDDLCHDKMRSITNRMKIHISSILSELDFCVPARVSISSAIRFPLYESIASNHFTIELMPERFPAYRERIIETIKDEYVSIAVNKDEHCQKDKLPPWDQMSKQMIECVDQWLKRVVVEVMDTCDKKIAVYKNYLVIFEKSGDEYRAGICKICIEKNEHYVRELKRLI